ncbi:MAG: TVP38/TMEM64 family protein [Syntrophobacteraceae bacterium]|nr:TVP38/TMEM64 family protein [Desulfobacteraceae bacterium]
MQPLNRSISNSSNPSRGSAAARAFALGLFIVAAIVVVRFSPVREYLTADHLGRVLDAAGLWAPLAFVFIYAAGVCLFVPGVLLTSLGAGVFGPFRGFLWVMAGAMLGASLSFYIGRTLGRDFAASLIGDRLRKYDDAIERNGFATVLYLRLVYFPFTALNFGMGLTRVRFLDYFWGTLLGIVVGTFIITYFVGTLRDAWLAGDWARLLAWQPLAVLALFVFSFFIPRIVEKVRNRNGGGRD